MVDGRAVATEKTAPRASTDGIERVRIAIPADLVDGGTHRIGLLAVAEPPVPVGAPIELRLSVVSEAAWSVRGTLVEGWIVGACDRAVTLDLIADGSVVASVPVTLEAGRPATLRHAAAPTDRRADASTAGRRGRGTGHAPETRLRGPGGGVPAPDRGSGRDDRQWGDPGLGLQPSRMRPSRSSFGRVRSCSAGRCRT